MCSIYCVGGALAEALVEALVELLVELLQSFGALCRAPCMSPPELCSAGVAKLSISMPLQKLATLLGPANMAARLYKLNALYTGGVLHKSMSGISNICSRKNISI